MISLITKWDAHLKGQPDLVLTYTLFGLAAIAFLVALFGTPLFKGIVAAWFILP